MALLPKVVLAVARNAEGFHIADVLLKGEAFDTDYQFQAILSETLKAHRARLNRQLIICADNARPHASNRAREFMDRDELRAAPDPFVSRDFAPSDFVLFGHTKGKLHGTEFMEKNDFLADIGKILNGAIR
jgi:hypothetical protein